MTKTTFPAPTVAVLRLIPKSCSATAALLEPGTAEAEAAVVELAPADEVVDVGVVDLATLPAPHDDNQMTAIATAGAIRNLAMPLSTASDADRISPKKMLPTRKKEREYMHPPPQARTLGPHRIQPSLVE
jgi:hypothetical protein